MSISVLLGNRVLGVLGLAAVMLGAFVACDFGKKATPLPAMPLVALDFNGEVVNKGILPLGFRGDGNISYGQGLEGEALDLSDSAVFRKPLVLTNSHRTTLIDYPGLTFLLWVKKSPNDYNSYTVAAQMQDSEDFDVKGWAIRTEECGSWSWWISDGMEQTRYKASPERQPLNDGAWHQIGFSMDFNTREVRLYYDGVNRAVYTLPQEDLEVFNREIFLGASPLALDPVMEAFNGMIDELSLWSRVLSPDQVAALFAQYRKPVKTMPRRLPDSLTVMTWNLWGGGMREGRFVGPRRIADMIAESGADLVAIQEGFASGPLIADMLDFYYYQRSEGLAVLSRYPLGQTYDVYRPRHAGAVTIELPRQQQVVFCPLYLSYLPNLAPYIMSGNASADSVLLREQETRGAEMRYISWELQALLDRNDRVPVILAGDFNSGSHLDWTAANRSKRYDLVLPYPATQTLERAGFSDAYREVFPDPLKTPGFTWSPRFKEVLHDRVNFIFYHGNTVSPTSARVVDQHPLGFPSDHAAVVVVFDWKE